MSKKKAAKVRPPRGIGSLPAKTLNAKAAREVSGGRKAGKGQHEFLVVKMNDVIVTSY